MPTAPHRGCVPGAAALPLNPASRLAAVAPRRGAPPTGHAVPGPESRASPMPAGIRNGAAKPTATVTGAAAAHGRRRGSVHRAAAARPPAMPRSVSPAALHDGTSIAAAMPPGAQPDDACAAPSPPPRASPVAADASRWRSGASRPNERAPATRSGTPDGARSGAVWIVGSARQAAWHAVPAARSAPMSAHPSVTLCRSGRRRSPWSTWRPAPSWVPSRPRPRPPPASFSPASVPTRSSSVPTRPSWRSRRRHRHGRGALACTALPPGLHAPMRGGTNV